MALERSWKHAVFLTYPISKKRLKQGRQSCEGKKPHDSAEDAEAEAIRMMEQSIYISRPYQCAACFMFHVGGAYEGGYRQVQRRFLYHERSDYGRVNGKPTTESKWYTSEQMKRQKPITTGK